VSRTSKSDVGPARKAKPLGRKLLWGALYVLAMLLLLEGVARLGLALVDTTWEPVVPPRVGMFDPMLGWKPRPDTCASSKRTGREVQYCINSKGLRDEEVPYEKPEGEFRIVLLGDSRVFGFGVPEEQHFARILEGYFKDLEVVNMGVDGYGVDQELLALRQEGFKYNPDLVMAYVAHYRDSRHMKTKVWGAAKPRFVLDPDTGELSLENQPVQNSDGFYVAALDLDRRLAGVSKLYKILRDLAVHVIEGAVQAREEQRKGDAATQPSEQDAAEAEKRHEAMNILAEAIVLQMAADCRERGVPFVLVTAIERLYTRLEDAGVPVLNITMPLDSDAYPLPGNLGHFNEAGNGAFAWELAQFLRQRQLVPTHHIPNRPPFNHMDARKQRQRYEDAQRRDDAS